MRNTIALAISTVALAACSSSTHIRASDPDARIYVNGEYVGTGHARYADRKPAFSKQEVMLRKEGCKEEHHSFRRNEQPHLGAIVSAYYLVLPIAWSLRYKQHRAYEFACLETARR